MAHRIGSDIGGTFTDLVLVSDDGAVFEIGKVLTTPAEPDEAVIAGTEQVVRSAGADRDDIAHHVHCTTLFTNALIQRRGAVTALITTKGFRDAVEIAREHRYDMYDLRMERPEPLAPRHLRFEVDERVLADGSVRQGVDEAEVVALARRLASEGVEAVAVCLLHAYRNPAHERRLGEILDRELPDLDVTLSSDLVPEIREYDRGSTTLANVYVKGIARRYLGRLNRRLRDELGIGAPLFVMQSNGGMCDIETAQEYPIRLVESGPAAGALATAHYGRLLGHADLLSFDMGGTTAKACLIVNGEPLVAPEFEIDRRYHFKKGSGLPAKVPVIEMIEIGTGGGSIARVDAMRRLQVGPQSAGADPGPVCYGRGGVEPTVTDADLILGYLDPNFFLGGKMALDVGAARQGVARLGSELGLDLVQAAWAIHQLANESMASAARIHAIERGQDVERFPVFAFGGSGPVHAFGVARILGNPRVIYPRNAGVMSAIGFLTAPLSFDLVRSLPSGLDDADWDEVRRLIEEMEAQGRELLAKTIPVEAVRFRRLADMRYRKQGYEIRVPIPAGRLDAGSRDEIRGNFEAAYTALYGHTLPNAPIDVISWRVIGYGPKPDLALPRTAAGDPARALKARRLAYLPEQGGLAEVPVYDRYALPREAVLTGPAILEERESTVVVAGQAAMRVDQWGNLIVDLPPAASRSAT